MKEINMEKIIKNKIPSIRTVAMPADTNSSGDIFGGWVLSQMDLAGGVLATQVSKKRITTVAIDKMRFHKPIKVGDIVSFYTQVNNTGNTSITIDIETFVTRKNDQLEKNQEIKVTEGKFVYVSIDLNGKPIPIR
tara:strand:- start:15 stop:419 length:405 start_codon:yes stop_codon:yes gene_type:complete